MLLQHPVRVSWLLLFPRLTLVELAVTNWDVLARVAGPSGAHNGSVLCGTGLCDVWLVGVCVCVCVWRGAGFEFTVRHCRLHAPRYRTRVEQGVLRMWLL